MQGTATYMGERVLIIDIAGKQAFVTTGQAYYLTWVNLSDLTNIQLIGTYPSSETLVIKCPECGNLSRFDLGDISPEDYLYCDNEECEHVLDIENAD